MLIAYSHYKKKTPFLNRRQFPNQSNRVQRMLVMEKVKEMLDDQTQAKKEYEQASHSDTSSLTSSNPVLFLKFTFEGRKVNAFSVSIHKLLQKKRSCCDVTLRTIKIFFSI